MGNRLNAALPRSYIDIEVQFQIAFTRRGDLRLEGPPTAPIHHETNLSLSDPYSLLNLVTGYWIPPR